MKREGSNGDKRCLLDKNFHCSQMQHLGIFWSDPAKPNGSESSGNSNWLEELPAALPCLYYQLWTTFLELLRSPQVQQFLFWQLYCQTTCLLGMLFSLQSIDVIDIVLGKIGFPQTCSERKDEKPNTVLCTFPSCVFYFTRMEVGKLQFSITWHCRIKRSAIHLQKSVIARLSQESPGVCEVLVNSLKLFSLLFFKSYIVDLQSLTHIKTWVCKVYMNILS